MSLHHVKLYANLRLVAGLREVCIPADNLNSLLSELVARIPDLENHLYEDGQLRRHIIITVNGHNVTSLDLPLADDDLIAIFPPIAGGCADNILDIDLTARNSEAYSPWIWS